MTDNNKNYSKTLNLPQTAFAMKANLTQREPQMRKQWEKQDLYHKILDSRSDSPKYILHDGPPYANGDIHMGHVINKVLKDIVLKYRTMKGFQTPYIPGWDCHGLPIEAKVFTELGDKAKTLTKLEIRKLCKQYASKYVKLQSKQFKDLGIFGDFENPYLTLKPQYEAGMCEVFAELVSKGLVYKQLKPIHWCADCKTALADAELEYEDISSPSIYVNFPVTKESAEKLVSLGLAKTNDNVHFMIWTTTPWTLAANLAISVHPDLDYKSISYNLNGKQVTSIVAQARLDAVIAAGKLTDYTVSDASVKGKELIALRYHHPYIETNPTEKDIWKVISANFVTTEDGTGLVHTAPGHGLEDYMAGQQNGLAVYSPVQDDGSYDVTVPQWLAGKKVLKVDKEVNEHLKNKGFLFAESQISHSYPHCWRSRTPVIFRATEQWFISVDRPMPNGISLRNLALQRLPKVKWIPAWGEKRITGMLESRPDWCISRQRSWGMPIPVFYNSNGDRLLTKESVLAVANHFRQKGSDSWFIDSPKEILGENFQLPAGFSLDDLQKEENIFDVWFESGCSWHSVAKNAGWQIPVDLYLEGSDQHRGWFQLSLLPALGAEGTEPFKTVLTHGFTVDAEGKKQSKSLGNYVNAQEEITKYGSDILRLWVSSVNYQEDMRCSDTLIGRLQDAYRKIRNTIRYLLGNTYDFDPAKNAVPYEKMFEIDRWAVQQLEKLISEVTDSYENFLFHRVYGLVYNFCVVEMSSIYMDLLKDRLYCDAKDSPSRRSSQTAMFKILDALTKLLAPVLAHTAEEIYEAMPAKSETAESVHLLKMPELNKSIEWQKEQPKWEKLMHLRDEVLKELENLRKNEVIASNQESSVTISTDDAELINIIEQFGTKNFAALCIVSEIKLNNQKSEKLVTAQKSSHQKCARCWNYWPSVGKNSDNPELCERCSSVIKSL
ncbi:MAG: isoleucine--tRNA ligase [Planctomycetes bacterium GWF2_41_51]|nr:MAG: isoleucine--tRNA ligase [Planctomycetes bacterium GWF2_41_51]HBG27032.1 isoleucine--tRNA ligase [Phycisphaerales bacterium]